MKRAFSDSAFFSNPGQPKDVLAITSVTIDSHVDLWTDGEKPSLFFNTFVLAFVHSLILQMWRCIRRYTR